MEAFLHATVNLQLDSFLAEREELYQQAPADEQQDNYQWEHEHHPLSETETHVQSLRIVQVLQGNVVWRRTDRRTHTTKVGCYRDRHGQRYTALTLGG